MLWIKFIPAITSQFRRTDLQPLEVVGCEGASIHTCDSHSRLQLWSSGARMVKWRDFSLEQPTLCDAASHAGDLANRQLGNRHYIDSTGSSLLNRLFFTRLLTF